MKEALMEQQFYQQKALNAFGEIRQNLQFYFPLKHERKADPKRKTGKMMKKKETKQEEQEKQAKENIRKKKEEINFFLIL